MRIKTFKCLKNHANRFFYKIHKQNIEIPLYKTLAVYNSFFGS